VSARLTLVSALALALAAAAPAQDAPPPAPVPTDPPASDPPADDRPAGDPPADDDPAGDPPADDGPAEDPSTTPLDAPLPAAGQGPSVRAGTDSALELQEPGPSEGFRFVVFGDRTGGRVSGLKVLEDAVAMTNHLDPDFVMTVGDLIQGYNEAPQWLRQATRFRRIMGKLNMPWYPVAGNHDVYARPRTPGGHIERYKQHFGPLYYSFDHRWAHFVVLFTDESLSYADPAQTQNLSPEQLAWLKADLAATQAEQVFVFLHHPRWLPKYDGCNWPEVHDLLAADGRVQAVFAGHIHRYRDDGARDGVHYYTMAVVGGGKSDKVPAAAFDHVNLVSVRRGRVGMSVIPVGAALGGDAIRGSELDGLQALVHGSWIAFPEPAEQAAAVATNSSPAVAWTNPTGATSRVQLEVDQPDGWTVFDRQPAPLILKPGQTRELRIRVRAEPVSAAGRSTPRLTARLSFRSKGGRSQPVEVNRLLPVRLQGIEDWVAEQPAVDRVLELDGQSALRVDGLDLDGLEAFTLECWTVGEPPGKRSALVAKTERSSLGIFWRDRDAPRPTGLAWLGGSYVKVMAADDWDYGAWTHVALVYDGAHLRLFVGGELSAEAPASGPLKGNRLPLYVGADVSSRRRPRTHFRGAIDEVRLSKVARYRGPFEPQARFEPDAHTLLLLHCDHELGRLVPDASGQGRHGVKTGAPRVMVPGAPGNGGL
jgi:hypothetical protein